MATRNINYCFMDENLKLYETLKEIWWRVLGLEEIVWDEHYGCCCFNNRSDGMQYTCAYIGPSATRAYQMGIADLTVGTAIKECRTIGGYMIWPRHTADVYTVGDKAAYGRIDITLLEIKDFYESNFSETEKKYRRFIQENTNAVKRRNKLIDKVI